AKPTAAAISSGIICDQKTGTTTWWLRSSGSEPAKMADIYLTGIIHNSWVNSQNDGVRPVIWVNYTDAGFSN
ncbi:MAG: hypothetical protein CW338_11355, partial [Clostridiales bacterium]|nr:hypothetical protein [Clostridiales bacterium]